MSPDPYSQFLARMESGPTPPLVEYLSWWEHDSNLPWRTDTGHLVNLLETAGEAYEKVRHILSSGYGCVQCAQADLREAVGLPAADPRQPHDHT